MKFNGVSFPHPVLGLGDAINGIAHLNPEPEIISSVDNYFINIICEHDNNELNDLVNSGQAEYFCEATCSDTLFREMVTSNSNKLLMEIPKKQVKGKIIFTCVLVSKSLILNYQNSRSHTDYSDYKFDIEKGDILAMFGEFQFNADIKYEKLKAVSSFMDVVLNDDDKAIYVNVDLNKSKIEVQLPLNDYTLFASDIISKEPKFVSIFHSSIVLNSLLIALYNFESYKDMLWAKVIEYRLKNDKMFEDISIEEKENIPEIAQRLLGNPFRRLISELQLIVESPNSNEED